MKIKDCLNNRHPAATHESTNADLQISRVFCIFAPKQPNQWQTKKKSC